MSKKVKSVKKSDGEYIAQAKDGTELARAGALNFKGERITLSNDSGMTFPESVWQVDKMMHRDGVLFIE